MPLRPDPGAICEAALHSLSRAALATGLSAIELQAP